MARSDSVFGRADRTMWRSFQVKGNLLAARARYVRETWGETAVQDVRARLGDEARAAFDASVLPFAWYPFTTMAEIDAAILVGPMAGRLASMETFGATVAQYDLPALYRVLFKLGNPSFVIGRVGTVYGTYVRGGAIRPTAVEKDRARLALVEGDLPFYFCDRGAAGWMRAAIELSGGDDAAVVQDRCVHRGDDRCEWECRWR